MNLLWGKMSFLLKSGKALGFLRREDAGRKPFLPAGRQGSHGCSSMQPRPLPRLDAGPSV